MSRELRGHHSTHIGTSGSVTHGCSSGPTPRDGFAALLSSKQGCPRVFFPSRDAVFPPIHPKAASSYRATPKEKETPRGWEPERSPRQQTWKRELQNSSSPCRLIIALPSPTPFPCRTPRYGAGGAEPAPSLPFQPVSIPAELLDENAPRPRFGAQANARGCQIPPCLQLPHSGLQGWGNFLFQTRRGDGKDAADFALMLKGEEKESLLDFILLRKRLRRPGAVPDRQPRHTVVSCVGFIFAVKEPSPALWLDLPLEASDHLPGTLQQHHTSSARAGGNVHGDFWGVTVSCVSCRRDKRAAEERARWLGGSFPPSQPLVFPPHEADQLNPHPQASPFFLSKRPKEQRCAQLSSPNLIPQPSVSSQGLPSQ